MHWFGKMIKDLGGMWLENWWQGNLGKKFVAKSKLCPMWMLTKGWIQQRRITIIKWPILWIWISLFFPQLLLWSPNELVSKVGMVTRMEVRHGLRNMAFNSLRSSWIWPPLTVQLLAVENNTVSPIWHHSPRWSASWLVTDWLHRTTSIMEGTLFSFWWSRLLVQVQIGLPYM